MKLDKILVSVMEFVEIFFSEIFLTHVTFWCQITNTENIILEVVNLVSITTENIFNTFLTDESTVFWKKREKNSRLTAVHCG